MARSLFLWWLIHVFIVEADERGDLVLKRTKDLGKTFTTIHEDIYSFGYIGAFLFFSVMEDSVRSITTMPPPPPSHTYYSLSKSSVNKAIPPSARRDPPVSCISRQTKETPSVEHCCLLPPLSRWGADSNTKQTNDKNFLFIPNLVLFFLPFCPSLPLVFITKIRPKLQYFNLKWVLLSKFSLSCSIILLHSSLIR